VGVVPAAAVASGVANQLLLNPVEQGWAGLVMGGVGGKGRYPQ
jgi:hypothetical protein